MNNEDLKSDDPLEELILFQIDKYMPSSVVTNQQRMDFTKALVNKSELYFQSNEKPFNISNCKTVLFEYLANHPKFQSSEFVIDNFTSQITFAIASLNFNILKSNNNIEIIIEKGVRTIYSQFVYSLKDLNEQLKNIDNLLKSVTNNFEKL